jgi:hypothetical protein
MRMIGWIVDSGCGHHLTGDDSDLALLDVILRAMRLLSLPEIRTIMYRRRAWFLFLVKVKIL